MIINKLYIRNLWSHLDINSKREREKKYKVMSPRGGISYTNLSYFGFIPHLFFFFLKKTKILIYTCIIVSYIYVCHLKG